MAIVNIYEHTRFCKLKNNKKRVWKDDKEAISAKRYGPDLDGGQMQYQLKWKGGWGTVKPHEIRPLMRILNMLDKDACERVYFKDKDQ